MRRRKRVCDCSAVIQNISSQEAGQHAQPAHEGKAVAQSGSYQVTRGAIADTTARVAPEISEIARNIGVISPDLAGIFVPGLYRASSNFPARQIRSLVTKSTTRGSTEAARRSAHIDSNHFYARSLDPRQNCTRAREYTFSFGTAGAQNEINHGFSVGSIGRRTDTGIILAGPSSFGMPGNGFTVGLGRQFNSLFRHHIRRDLPVSNQAGRGGQELTHFAEAGARNVKAAEPLHFPIYCEAGIQGRRCHGHHGHRQRSDIIRHLIYHCERNGSIEPLSHSFDGSPFDAGR